MSFPRPANTPWLVPYLTVRDASAAIAFYRNAFGFGVQDQTANARLRTFVRKFRPSPVPRCYISRRLRAG
jgi:hypothetical protein